MNQRKANELNARHWYKQNLALLEILKDRLESESRKSNPHLRMSEMKYHLTDCAIHQFYGEDKFEAESMKELEAEIKRRMK